MESYGADDFRAKHPLGCEGLGVTTLQVKTAESRAERAGACRGANQAGSTLPRQLKALVSLKVTFTFERTIVTSIPLSQNRPPIFRFLLARKGTGHVPKLDLGLSLWEIEFKY